MSKSASLEAAWSSPPSIYRSAPFWSWNSELDPDRLQRAIESMHSAGMGGFFMHSRYGLKTPYLSEEWWTCIAACVEKARELDMKAYLYDEDRWPSGAAGGVVTRPHVEYRQKHCVAAPPDEQPEGGEHVAMFAVELDESGALREYEAISDASEAGGRKVLSCDVHVYPTSGWFNDGGYLDTMNADAVAEFIHVTHQAYADRCGKDFGSLIPAIFTDEPNYNHGGGGGVNLPWTDVLPREFIKRRGYDVRDRLPEVVCPTPDGFSKVRHDFYRTVTELFVENFSAQIGRWCGKHDIALTGHMLAEETLGSQIRVIGAAMPHYEHMQWPGIDILTDQIRELTTAKQCSSVAAQLGRERVLSELYGCTGWDWPLEGHKFVGDWQFALGVNFRCPHLTHYSLAGGAKRDYPASIFAHSPWWTYYDRVEDYFARLSFMLTEGKPLRDVLVLHTVESGWGAYNEELMNELNEQLIEISRTLLDHHLDWDYGDESLLASHAKASGGELTVGEMTYRLVVVPPAVTLRQETVKLLNKLLKSGGKVLFVGRTPTKVDAEDSEDASKLVDAADTCAAEADEYVPAVEKLLERRRVSVRSGAAEDPAVWTMLRKIGDGQVLFLASHDREATHVVDVRLLGGGPAVLWDCLTGERTRLASEGDDGATTFSVCLPPTGSAVVSVGLDVPDAADSPAETEITDRAEISGPFEIERTEPNTLPLDYCRMKFGDAAEFSEPMPVLQADSEIRAKFGLGTRFGREHQPWYLYAKGTVDTAERGPVQLKWSFHVTDVPSKCVLALENPEDYTVTVNGKPLGEPDGWWVDEDIETVDVTDLIQAGDNDILLDFNYRPNMEIEDMYLLGEFGVATRDDGPQAPGAMTLVAPLERLELGSWVGQGLDFYTAGVRYRLTVKSPGDGKRMRIALPGVKCTCAVIHVNGESFALPWAPFAADVTDALKDGENQVIVEVIGGRHNTFGPLHTPWRGWTGPGEFDPGNGNWRFDYYLNDHGLTAPVVVETLG